MPVEESSQGLSFRHSGKRSLNLRNCQQINQEIDAALDYNALNAGAPRVVIDAERTADMRKGILLSSTLCLV